MMANQTCYKLQSKQLMYPAIHDLIWSASMLLIAMHLSAAVVLAMSMEGS